MAFLSALMSFMMPDEMGPVPALSGPLMRTQMCFHLRLSAISRPRYERSAVFLGFLHLPYQNIMGWR